MKVKEVIRFQLDLAQMTSQRLVEDFTDEELLQRTCPGCNHPAWQLGHLIASEHRMGEGIRSGSMPPLPEGFEQKHARENARNDNPADFLSKEEYLGLHEAQRGALLKLLDELSEAQLDQPAPESIRHLAPTVAAIFSLAASHQTMHAGQLTPLRRKLGKPLVM